MAIRMKIALKGAGYSLAAEEVTDRFDAAKEARFIAAGIADRVDPLDLDGDGARGGSVGADELLEEHNGYALFRIGGGWYRIAGPDLEEPLKVKGRPAANDRFAELLVGHAIRDAIENGVLKGQEGAAAA